MKRACDRERERERERERRISCIFSNLTSNRFMKDVISLTSSSNLGSFDHLSGDSQESRVEMEDRNERWK